MTNQQVTSALLALLVIGLIVMIVRVLRKDGNQNDSKAVLAGAQNRAAATPRPTPAAATPVARRPATKARALIYVESPRRPSNAEMKVLIDYYQELIVADGGDIANAMYSFVGPVHVAWENAKEESQFIFSIPIEGTRSYYFRRRKFNFKLVDAAQRRCPGKNVWLFNRQ